MNLSSSLAKRLLTGTKVEESFLYVLVVVVHNTSRMYINFSTLSAEITIYSKNRKMALFVIPTADEKTNYTGTQRYEEMNRNTVIHDRAQKNQISRVNPLERNGRKIFLWWKIIIPKR